MAIIPQLRLVFDDDGSGKTCSACRQWFPLSNFRKNKNSKDGFSCQCKLCCAAAWKRWYAENSDKHKASAKKYKMEHPEKVAADKERRKNDPLHRERRNAYLRAHRRKKGPKGIIIAQCHTRRARAVKAEGQFTEKQWQALCRKYGNVCLCCGTRGKLVRDHVIPLAFGGSNDISNIQPLCQRCNNVKATRSTDYRPK